MSRMIDRLENGKWLDGELPGSGRLVAAGVRREAAQYPILVADDVVIYAMKLGIETHGFRNLDYLPNIAPPFPQFWIESRFQHMTAQVTTGDAETLAKYGNTRVQFPYCIGCHFHANPRDEAMRKCTRPSLNSHVPRCFTAHPDATWILEAIMIVEWQKFKFEMRMNFAIAVDAQGRPMGNMFMQLSEREKDELGMMNTFISPALLALSFCHCRNIQLIPSDPSVELQKHRERSGRKPLLRYHTLSIGGIRKLFEQHGMNEKGIAHAIHTCRGHFKRFTADKPLLGKHVGEYWWGDHVRGAGGEGVATKDYRAKHVSELPGALPAGPAAKIKPSARHFMQAAAIAGIANLKASE